MKKMIYFLLPVALWANVCRAEDSDWVKYAESKGGGVYFVHRTKIKNRGNKIFQVWTKLQLAAPEQVFSNKLKPTYSYSIAQQIVNCNEQTLQPLSTVFYDPRGTVVGNSGIEETLPAVPGSVGDTLVSLFCE